jgi:hypothetical protein
MRQVAAKVEKVPVGIGKEDHFHFIFPVIPTRIVT